MPPLVHQLKSDADVAIEETEAAFHKKEAHLNEKLKTLATQVEELNSALSLARNESDNRAAKLEQLTEQLSTTKQELSITRQRVDDQDTLIEEKDKVIESLEQKHQHSREAMAHYRQSVQEQREQDIRRHDQLLQEEKAEVRALQQSLSIKQTELTESARANAEFSATLTALKKELNATQAAGARQQNEISELVESTSNDKQHISLLTRDNEVYANKLATAEEGRDALASQLKKAELDQAELRGKLKIKDELIQLLSEGGDQKTTSTNDS